MGSGLFPLLTLIDAAYIRSVFAAVRFSARIGHLPFNAPLPSYEAP
jgi:hypothetical protein